MNAAAKAFQRGAGADPNLSREAYDALDRVNFSSLKHFAKSPAHYLAAKQQPRDSAAMQRGRCVHIACLEPHRFASEVVVFDGATRRGKEWERFEAANLGKEILTAKEYEGVEATAIAVRGSLQAMKYLSAGQGEVSVLWESCGHSLKSRLDWVSELALVDLKSTRDASPEGFGRECQTHGTHIQAAFYSDAWEQKTGERRPYVLVAAEPTFPHPVQVYRVPEPLLELGRHIYQGWLRQLDECRKANVWPGYAADELDLILPRWATFTETGD